MHLFFLLFCSSECSDQFHDELEAEGYTNKHLIFVPLPPEQLVGDDRIKDNLRERVMALPIQYTGTCCDNCTARHMEGTPKFKTCAVCNSVRYCSKECQIEHWKAPNGHGEAAHHDVCGKPLEKTALVLKLPAYPAEELKQHRDRELVEERTHAGCFDEIDRHRRNSARAGTCSWHKCTRKVEGAVPMSFVMTACRLNGPPHTTPTAYCCKGHNNRDHVGCVGAGVGAKK